MAVIEGLNSLTCPTANMVQFFFKRTALHVGLVKQNLARLVQSPEFLHLASELHERGASHDQSKYSADEIVPYIWLTEYYRCKAAGERFAYPEQMEERVEDACRRHVSRNPHHYEFHRNGRDMSTVDLLEMICDWVAMGQEAGAKAARATTYANQKIGKKIILSECQRAVVYRALAILEG